MTRINTGRLLLAIVALAFAGVALFHGFDGSLFPHDGWAMLAEGVVALPIADQIKQYQAKRQAAQDAATAIVQKSLEEGRTLDDRETEEHKGHVAAVSTIDQHLTLLIEHEKMVVAGAKQVQRDAGNPDAGGAVDLPGGGRQVSIKSNLPPGIRFTRFALAMAKSKGNVMQAHEIAKSQFADTPEVINCLKAAISLGDAKDLALANFDPMTMLQKAAVTAVAGTDTAVTQYQDITNDFIELLRPKLILGRMTQISRVPFMSRLGRALTGVTGSFVGEGAPKPVQKQTYDNVTLGYAKVAVIVVLTDEANRFGTIDVQMRARDDMLKGIATYIDKRFMDPAYSGVANVSPASITNAARRVQGGGVSSIAAIDALMISVMADFTTSDVDPTTAVWVMSAGTALRLALKKNAYDEPAYPGMADAVATGRGTWYGLPVLVSNSMVATGSPTEGQIALVTQEEVSLAEGGGISIDMSQEASVQMNDAPTAGAQSLVSLWQNNLIGIRAEQYINWGPRRASNLGIVLIENFAP